MGAQLHIVWDGEVAGLTEGRLSLVVFGPALFALLRAARNIARRRVAEALGEPYNPESATRSTIVDLQLSSFRAGSADLTLDVVPLYQHYGSVVLDSGFSESVTRELHSSIRDEVRGVRRDRFVNEFLRALPKEIPRQRFAVIVDGREEDVLELVGQQLSALPESSAEQPLESVQAAPGLLLLHGRVEGVSFGARGEHQLRFTPFQGTPVEASATQEQVLQAIAVQAYAQALFLMGTRPRLLWIKPHDAPLPALTAEQREEHIFTQWAELLERLAK
ncbi:MAG TPA: hypothetical protein VEU33_28135 [Archangium sp.]|nr:hypothetical protein [Archangium sp.]